MFTFKKILRASLFASLLAGFGMSLTGSGCDPAVTGGMDPVTGVIVDPANPDVGATAPGGLPTFRPGINLGSKRPIDLVPFPFR